MKASEGLDSLGRQPLSSAVAGHSDEGKASIK